MNCVMLSLPFGVGILFISVHDATAAASTTAAGSGGGRVGGAAYILTKNRSHGGTPRAIWTIDG